MVKTGVEQGELFFLDKYQILAGALPQAWIPPKKVEM